MKNSDTIPLIKKVGRGKTLSKSMNSSESRKAFDLILAGSFSEAQLGAFLQALRIKELSLDELTGLTEGMYNQMNTVARPRKDSLVINLSIDTPRKNGLITCMAGYLLPFWGVDVCIVSNHPVLAGDPEMINFSYKCARQVLDIARKKSGVVPPGELRELTCNELLSGWNSLEKVRSELGFRSLLHTLEKLVNPWKEGPMLLGISHDHYAHRLVETLNHFNLAGSRVVLGNHGSLDLNLHKPTKVYSWRKGVQDQEIPGPADLGLDISTSLYTSREVLTWPEKITGGDEGMWNAVYYHLAYLLWGSNQASSIEQGLELVIERFS